MQIDDLSKISVRSFKTSCCYTGQLLDETQEQTISPIKEKLFEKALQQYETITTCGERCFQVKDRELLFWFNIKGFTTKILVEDLEEFVFPLRKFIFL